MSDLTLTAKVKSYINETINLIDYTSIAYYLTTLDIKESGCIIHNRDNIFYSTKAKNFSDNSKVLQLKISKDSYNINTSLIKSEDIYSISKKKNTWLSYHSEKLIEPKKRKYHRLCEGDIFKLGKSIFKVWKIYLGERTTMKSSRNSVNYFLDKNQDAIKVLEYGNYTMHINKLNIKSSSDTSGINNNNNKKTQLTLLDENNNNHLKESDINNNNKEGTNNKRKKSMRKASDIEITKNTCRICYGNETSKENPLFHPCQCAGSVGFIHYQCLKNWLNSKMVDEEISDESVCISYKLQENFCEICKAKYPDFIRYKGTLFDLSFYKPSFKKYMVIEGCISGKEGNRTIFVLNLDEEDRKLSIGRSGETDMNINDLSCSRFHSYIFQDKNSVFLEDGGSKFGTLVLVQNPELEISMGFPLRLQVNKNYIKLNLKKSFSLFSCCKPITIDSSKEYSKQNMKFCDVLRKIEILEINKDPEYNDDGDELRKKAEEEREREKKEIMEQKEKEKKEKELKEKEKKDNKNNNNINSNNNNNCGGDDDDNLSNLTDDFKMAKEIVLNEDGGNKEESKEIVFNELEDKKVNSNNNK